MLSCILMGCLAASPVLADVYINVMAVNGSPDRKETPVKFDLPGDLKADDILDTNGLQLEYNPTDGNYVVSGHVGLDSKESKTYRIRLKDIWKMSAEDVAKAKDEINKGFEQIGTLQDSQKAQALKEQLMQRLNLVVEHQSVKAETIEKRIDAARTYKNEMRRILDQALAVDYWRSEPGGLVEKTIKLRVEAENPKDNTNTKVKLKSYLPTELKPQHVVEAQGFEVRYDEGKKQPFLFREEEIPPGEKRSYQVSLLDVWNIPQHELDYLKSRAEYCWGYLKNSKFDQTAKILYEHANGLIGEIVESQSQNREIKEHISAFRVNTASFASARTDVENMEKLLAIYREDLEKSKVENVLQKMRSLKGVADVANQVFAKKPTESNTWNYIGYVVVFLGGLAGLYFAFLFMRSMAKPKTGGTTTEKKS